MASPSRKIDVQAVGVEFSTRPLIGDVGQQVVELVLHSGINGEREFQPGLALVSE